MGGSLAVPTGDASPAEEKVEAGVHDWRGASGLSGLLQEESLLALLEFGDARSLAALRRCTKLKSSVLADEARQAELRAKVLELLEDTKFAFASAFYVIGMNGPYFSADSLVEKHYGIPASLPSLICQLFRASMPGVRFTSIRIQKFASAANFGRQHRTLAFSLASPQQENEANPLPVQDTGSLEFALPGHVLCLPDRGCIGGHGDVCEEVDAAGSPATSWHLLTQPQPLPRWVRFPGGAWLRWHWPQAGNLFAVTVSCEPSSNCSNLRQRERRHLEAMGFHLPDGLTQEEEGVSELEEEEEAGADDQEPVPAADGPPPPRRRPTRQHVAAARQVLGLAMDAPTPQEVDEAFRAAIRTAHPDMVARAVGAEEETPSAPSPPWSSWRVSQLTWARRIMRAAAAEGGVEDDAGAIIEGGVVGELLMLVPPLPALMPPPDEDEDEEVGEDAPAGPEAVDGDVGDPGVPRALVVRRIE